MHLFRFVFLFVFISFLYSCNGDIDVLQDAEGLMDSRPDSALYLLKSLSSESLSDSDYANYCLLLTQAMDKSNLTWWKSDTLFINQAYSFYEKTSDERCVSLCCFYKGSACYERGDFKQAAWWYKQAEVFSLQTADVKLISLVYSSLGYVNMQLNLFPNALVDFKKALSYAIRANNKKYILSNTQDIARVFDYIGETDSASYYFRHSLTVLSDADSVYHALVYHNLASFYEGLVQSDSALKYVSKALAWEGDNDKCRSYLILGNTYYQREQPDLAKQFWDKALKTSDPSIKVCVYHSLYQTYKTNGDYKSAVDYAEKCLQYADSVYRIEALREVADIQEKYDNETLRNRNLESEVRMLYLYIALGLCLFALALLVSIYSRYRHNQQQRIRELVAGKEIELDQYRTRLEHLEGISHLEEQEKENWDTERGYLKQQIKERTDEIIAYKNSYKTLNLNYEKSLRYESIAKGMKLYDTIHTNVSVSKGLLFSTDAIKDFVYYYTYIHEDSMNRLRKAAYGLTVFETAICILFGMSLSHQQVADILGNSPQTLSRAKLRLKTNRFRLKNDDRKLEEILVALWGL